MPPEQSKSLPLTVPYTQTDLAHTFLEEGTETLKQRAALRDAANGERSMEKTVAAFNALTGHNLTVAEGWEFMVLLKLVRARQGKYHRDDYVDLASYGSLLGEQRSIENA